MLRVPLLILQYHILCVCLFVGSQAIAISKQDKYIWVATMERVINCYSNRGKRLKGAWRCVCVVLLCVFSFNKLGFHQ